MASHPPTDQQQKAADPGTSVWVTANAGTGKTRVLADRVLRLLLAAERPTEAARRILCITFTRAAAAEMLNRIQATLTGWAVMSDAELADELGRLTGAPATAELCERARSLFAIVLDLPGGLSIMTIHAFCQALLRRFPIEAGLAPHFALIDDRDAAERLREAQDQVLQNPAPAVADALCRLAVWYSELDLFAVLDEMIKRRSALLAARRAHADAGSLHATLRTDLGLADQDAAGLKAQACADAAFDRAGLQAARDALLRSDKASDQKRGGQIDAWLALPDAQARTEGLDDYVRAFLTQKNAPTKLLATKAVATAEPDLVAVLEAEQQRLVALANQLNATAIAERTRALLELGLAVLERYDSLKRQAAELDYDDLIAHAHALLTQDTSGWRDWVAFKLDGGIDHVLIDEAQDTSPRQWAIIDALIGEFFAGEGAREAQRTVFVVGDGKQSIYSFQGADLPGFRAQRARLHGQAQAARLPWLTQALDQSFRSTPLVLRTVDAVFAEADAGQGVIDDDDTRHHAHKADDHGVIELWPLARWPEAGPPPGDAWELPVETAEGADPRVDLANAIAEQIADWLRKGEMLARAGRAITAGDVMVLLPRRGVFQAMMVRALKAQGIPVAGADRLKLTDDIAVQDLMALGDVLLLPDDDLNLAAVLKSPLFGLDDDALFELAHQRAGSLFESLTEKRALKPVFAEAHARLSRLLNRADFVPPYELFAGLLGPDGGRARMLQRLGTPAAEPIEAFLDQARAYENGHVASLQGFLQWFRRGSGEIKRDAEAAGDRVRVITVHGAKGLEAPIVFLPETTYQPRDQDRLIWRDDGIPLWRAPEPARDAHSAELIASRKRALDDERRRLLYVALTRARERLYVAGWLDRKQSRKDEVPAGTWYSYVHKALCQQADVTRISDVTLKPTITGDILRLEGRDPDQIAEKKPGATKVVASEPAWFGKPAPKDPLPARPLTPSHLDDTERVADPPRAGREEALRRGRLVHEALQLAPRLDRTQRDAWLSTYLGGAPDALTLRNQIERVLDHPDLAAAFTHDGRAEVPLAGMVNGMAIAGQVDRLVVTPSDVWLIDYKTNQAPPTAVADVPKAYLRQMAAYRVLLRDVFPEHAIRCTLVWTASGSVMPLDGTVLDAHIPTT